jgi:hypothetical protein
MYTNANSLTIERIQGIIKDIIWIGINNDAETYLPMPVKSLINKTINNGTKELAIKMATTTRGTVMLCSGLTLHWQHVYDDVNEYVKISFAIGGCDVHDMGYNEFVETAQEYFEHLDKTGSRTF